MPVPLVINGRDLATRITEIEACPRAIMAIGRPVCPACQLVAASLEVIGAARPGVVTAIVDMVTEDDWAIREDLLWPRGIRVSPAAVPALVLLEGGVVVATRHGSAPASDLDAWISESFGPPGTPVPGGVAPAEQAVLDRTAARRAQHGTVKGR